MRSPRKKALEDAGWRVGSADDFLGLNEAESRFVEIKLALARLLRTTRTRQSLTQVQLARKLGSSQSRVAKLEAGDPTVTLDLLVRSLLAAGARPSELAKAVSVKRRT